MYVYVEYMSSFLHILCLLWYFVSLDNIEDCNLSLPLGALHKCPRLAVSSGFPPSHPFTLRHQKSFKCKLFSWRYRSCNSLLFKLRCIYQLRREGARSLHNRSRELCFNSDKWKSGFWNRRWSRRHWGQGRDHDEGRKPESRHWDAFSNWQVAYSWSS